MERNQSPKAIATTNKKKTKNLRIDILEKFFFVFTFLLAARATLFTSNLDPRSNFFGFVFAFVPLVALYIKHSISLHPRFIAVLLIFGGWTVVQYVTNSPFKFFQYFILFYNLFAAYLLVRLFRRLFFYYFERTVVCLAAISVLLWIVMHLIGPENLTLLSLFEPASGTSAGSFLFFNIPDVSYYEGTGMLGLHRNCGFCWEPGMFASFLDLAIFFNLVRCKNRIVDNPSLWILIAALLSTFSTTGYVALLVIIATHFVWGKIDLSLRNLTILSGFGIVIAVVIQLPFMKEKILRAADVSGFITENANIVNYIESEGQMRTVDRFEGMTLDMLNINDKPLCGYGLSRENSFIYKNVSQLINISNGTTSIFANFGLLIGSLLLISIICTSIFIRRRYHAQNTCFFFLFVTISISYSFVSQALFMAICHYYWFSNQPLFETKKKIK